MKIEAKNVSEYLENIPEDRKEAFSKLRETILQNIPNGFEECLSYGMIGYVIPHSIYPPGYHCTPSLPLPFANIASQKNFIALYHMGLYADSDLLKWFENEYPKHTNAKLDMGKSCIRFKKPSEIPFHLIAELMQKIDVESYIKTYETQFKNKKKQTK